MSKSTESLAAADVSSSSGKAKKARQYRIPIVLLEDLLAARIGSSLEAVAVSEAMKVVQCPDCYSTWTVSGRSAAHSSRRCDGCASIAAKATPKSTVHAPTTAGVWTPPIVEWLVCEQCQSRWHQEVSPGRKPRLCTSCR